MNSTEPIYGTMIKYHTRSCWQFAEKQKRRTVFGVQPHSLRGNQMKCTWICGMQWKGAHCERRSFDWMEETKCLCVLILTWIIFCDEVCLKEAIRNDLNELQSREIQVDIDSHWTRQIIIYWRGRPIEAHACVVSSRSVESSKLPLTCGRSNGECSIPIWPLLALLS